MYAEAVLPDAVVVVVVDGRRWMAEQISVSPGARAEITPSAHVVF